MPAKYVPEAVHPGVVSRHRHSKNGIADHYGKAVMLCRNVKGYIDPTIGP